jgi:NADPH-dependent curcumin reductase CurA
VRCDVAVVACGSIATTMEQRRGGTCSWWCDDSVQGYIISDHFDRFGEFHSQTQEWVREGRLRYRETIVEGIENAPHAFVGLLRGENIGKMLVKVGPSE